MGVSSRSVLIFLFVTVCLLGVIESRRGRHRGWWFSRTYSDCKTNMTACKKECECASTCKTEAKNCRKTIREKLYKCKNDLKQIGFDVLMYYRHKEMLKCRDAGVACREKCACLQTCKKAKQDCLESKLATVECIKP